MSAAAVWAGVIVRDLAASAEWYRRTLGCRVREKGEGWVSLSFPDGSGVELHAGDPMRPGLVFPSYGADGGPPVMPGYSVEDPDVRATGLTVVRSLPAWIVVVAPDGLRVVLTDRERQPGRGLVGFRYTSPAAAEQRAFLGAIGAADEVEQAAAVRVVPIVAADRDSEITDPDGTAIDLRASPQALHRAGS